MIEVLSLAIQPLEKELSALVEEFLTSETRADHATREIEIAPAIIDLRSENLLAK